MMKTPSRSPFVRRHESPSSGRLPRPCADLKKETSRSPRMGLYNPSEVTQLFDALATRRASKAEPKLTARTEPKDKYAPSTS